VRKLKKNVSFPNELPNYDRGIDYYEELRQLLINYNISSTYIMGIDLVLKYGLKTFFSKFRRKEIRSGSLNDFASTNTRETHINGEVESSSQELIFLLANMIRSIGYQNGIEWKN
jgi:hypothetical protein